MHAIARIMLVVKIAVAVANCSPPSNISSATHNVIITNDDMIIAKMPMPEIGLDDVPTSPAIYAHAAATNIPMITANNTPTVAIIALCMNGKSFTLTNE